VSPAAPLPTSDGADVVQATAREGEIDRYFSALMAPSKLRTDLMAISAFGAVIGHVPRSVREPLMGEMRLQWWRDALLQRQKDDGSVGQPVADAVLAAAARHALPSRLFETVIDAVTGILTDETAVVTDSLQALARFEGGLFALAAHIHGGASVTGYDPLFEQAGRAYGLARGLCRIPVALREGWPPLPTDLAAAAEVATAVDADAGAHDRVVEELTRAHQDARMALTEVRHHASMLPPAAIRALAPLVMVEPYLEAQSQSARTLLTYPVEVMPLRRMWRIWRATRRRRI
jgi:phytoene synthase